MAHVQPNRKRVNCNNNNSNKTQLSVYNKDYFEGTIYPKRNRAVTETEFRSRNQTSENYLFTQFPAFLTDIFEVELFGQH